MKCYYLHLGSEQQGPFSLEELQQKNIQPDTPVWKEGFSNWIKAGELNELQTIFAKKPPLYRGTVEATAKPSSNGHVLSSTEKAWRSIGKSLGVGGATILLFFIGFYLYNATNAARQARLSLPAPPPQDYEHVFPKNYLEATGTYKPIIFTHKWHIDGLLLNKASHTNYKDVRVKVNFYSQTRTVVGSTEYVLYQFVPQGTTQQFILEVERPDAAATCGWEATGGVWY